MQYFIHIGAGNRQIGNDNYREFGGQQRGTG